MSSAAAVPAGREWGLQPVYTVLDLDSPRVLLTVAREAIIPGRIGIRKDWKPLGLLRFTGKADVELRTGAITYGFSCKDNIIGGRFSVNVPDRLLEYRKKLRLPNGASIALSGGCQYVEAGGPQLRDRFKPMLAVQVQLGDMGAGNAVWSGDGFDLKNRISTPLLDYPKLEFEVYSSVKVPLLTARYSIQHGGTVGSLNSRRGPRRKLLQSSDSATAVAQALGSGDANAAAKAIASSTNGSAVASALAQAITSGQGTAAANAVAQAASQGAGTNAAQALAQALVQTANQTAGIPAATQALNDVGDAGVQSVEDDTCSTLAKLATDALYRGDFDTAAHILATVFIQGGECGKAVSDGINNNIPQLGCAPLLKAVATAYQLAQAAGQGDAFEAGLAAQPSATGNG
ncbi:hypothetical protein N2152v2_000328 [Parachlorella kessleri]